MMTTLLSEYFGLLRRTDQIRHQEIFGEFVDGLVKTLGSKQVHQRIRIIEIR